MKAETLDVFKIFEKAHGEDQAKKIITYFENADNVAIEREVAIKTNALATKEDLFATREDLIKEIGSVRKDLTREISSVRNDLTKEIGSLKEEIAKEMGGVRKDFAQEIGILRAETANGKADMIKWMFIFWIGQIAATFGLIILYLKK